MCVCMLRCVFVVVAFVVMCVLLVFGFVVVCVYLIALVTCD